MRNCSICTHAGKNEIDLALGEGASVRSVATRFKLSKSAVSRHRHGCLGPRLQAAARITQPSANLQKEKAHIQAITRGLAEPTAADVVSLAGLTGRLARSLDRLDGAAETAFGEGAHTALAALSAQLHRGVETVARLQGLGVAVDPERPSFSISINLPPPNLGSDAVLELVAPTPCERTVSRPLAFLDALQQLRDAKET